MPIALLSVADKTGIVEFAQGLLDLGFDLIGSEGTTRAVTDAGLPMQDIAKFTGREPILDHQVVTLDPAVHAGLLALQIAKHQATMKKYGFLYIALVCVDMYPLKKAIEDKDATVLSIIKATDIGGPTMLRSAAKGGRVVICHPADRMRVLEWLKADKPDEEAFLQELRGNVEGVVADYCLASGRYHSGGKIDGLVGFPCHIKLKYGENSHQVPARAHSMRTDDPLALDRLKSLRPSLLSHTTWTDIHRALQTITHVAAGLEKNMGQVPFIAIGVKHGNPCGAAIGKNPDEVLRRMIEGDGLAIFGGVVMTNFPIRHSDLEILHYHSLPKDKSIRPMTVVIAPQFPTRLIEHIRKGSRSTTFFENPALATLGIESLDKSTLVRPLRGIFLTQPNYTHVPSLEEHLPSDMPEFDKAKLLIDLVLAWAVGSTSNSNTTTIVKDRMLLGNGVSEMSRVASCERAVERARKAKHGSELSGAVAYTDGFFPFEDAPQVLNAAGITTILGIEGHQNRRQEIIDFCREAGILYILLKNRGFFGH